MGKNNICYIASAGAGKTTKLVEDAVTNAANESCKNPKCVDGLFFSQYIDVYTHAPISPIIESEKNAPKQMRFIFP